MKSLLQTLLCLACFAPGLGLAHKSSDSYLSLTLAPEGRLSGRWDIALRDLDLLLPLDANADRRLTWGEVRRAAPAIQALATRSLQLRNGDNDCTLDPASAPLAIEEHVDGRYVVLSLAGICARGDALEVDYRLLSGIDAAHRGIARIHLNGRDHALVLTPDRSGHAAADSATATWWSHVREGMHHIATGYDHLLFLLSLLLPVALLPPRPGQPGPWRDTLMLVTAFTVAHSLTLGLATFDLIRLPSRWVESVIAASVLIAALHNLRESAARTRWAMALAFGLVHGLGFATLLGELPTAMGPRLTALLGFNLGVEIGQLLAVLFFLPLALALARRSSLGYCRLGVQGSSLAIALLAFVWLCQRLFNWQLIPG